MVEWMRHKDGGKMWFRRDKSQAGGMIGVINVVFILQPANANQEGFKKTERNSGQLVLKKQGELLGS